MAEGKVEPPRTSRSEPKKKSSKVGWIVGLGALALAGLWYYEKRKGASSTSSSQSVTYHVISPSSTGLGPTNTALYDALYAQNAALAATLSQGLATVKASILTAINTQRTSTNPGATSQSVGADLQVAPTRNPFAYKGKLYTPISTYQQTLADFKTGTEIAFKTKTGTVPFVLKTATEYKAVEHTGNHNWPQYTSYKAA